MSLAEIARFTDVYEADLAAAFLESHGIPVSVTERYQTTVDPLMQRALGIRLMAPESEVQQARALLAMARAGEFATDEGDDLDDDDSQTRAAGRLMAVAAFATGGFWGTSLPRRFRPVPWQGMVVSSALILLILGAGWGIGQVLLNPP